MEFYFKRKRGIVHLYLEDGMLDKNLGELKVAGKKKMKTTNPFGTNYEIKDVSGIFRSGKKYAISSSKGLKGVMVKKLNGKYEFTSD